MPTMKFLFLSVFFIMYIKLRYKSMGIDYPPHVPHHIPKIIELEIVSIFFVDDYDYNLSFKILSNIFRRRFDVLDQ